MNVAIIQNAPKLKKSSVENFAKSIKNINADILIFPELALNGYLLEDAVFEDAFSLNELEEFATLSVQKDIVFGCVLQENNKFYNAALYCSKGKIKHIHHKSILPNYGLFQEARFFFEGGALESFQTDFGNVLITVCEEMFSAKIIEKISSIKPDLLIVLASSPARGFLEKGLLIEEQWQALLSTAAILSGSHVIFVNRVGFEDGLGFWGGSRILNPKGKNIYKAKLFNEEVLHGKIDYHLSKTQKYLLRIK